jgi:hypothetical protein
MSRISLSLCAGLLLLAGSGFQRAEAGEPELVFSTFLGGASKDEGTGIAVDGAGHVWVAGRTSAGDFPALGTPLSEGTGLDAFVARFDASGALLWASTFGGTADDEARALAIDQQGNAYVTGITRPNLGTPLDFPYMGSLPLPAHPQYEETFVAKIDPSGALVYSVLLGGSSSDISQAIAVDATGAAWVAGYTNSPDFPQVRSLSPALRGFGDAFLVKIDPTGSALELSTYFGGSGVEQALGVAVDGSGRAHIVGLTYSEDFPTLVPAPPTGSTANAFLTTLAPSGALVRSIVFGGSNDDLALAVAADAAGHAFVFGLAASEDFPRRGAFQPGGPGSFLTRFDAAGHMVSSLLLGDLFVWSSAIAVDPGGRIHLAGFAGGDGARLARIDPAITRILDTVVLAGTGVPLDPEGAWAVAADARGRSYLTGVTHSADFPTVRAAQPVYAGGEDAFVAKIAAPNAPPVCTRATALPGRLWPPNGKLQAIAIPGVTDPDGDRIVLTVTTIRQDEPLSNKGQPDATGIGTARPMLRADRAGNGDGRVYHLRFAADDGHGGRCEGEVTVCVPHDQRGRGCGDGGALVDSAGSGG